MQATRVAFSIIVRLGFSDLELAAAVAAAATWKQEPRPAETLAGAMMRSHVLMLVDASGIALERWRECVALVSRSPVTTSALHLLMERADVIPAAWYRELRSGLSDVNRALFLADD